MNLLDMSLLIRLGVVSVRPAPRYRASRLTPTGYTHERRLKLYAAGLTARGTPRKYHREAFPTLGDKLKAKK